MFSRSYQTEEYTTSANNPFASELTATDEFDIFGGHVSVPSDDLLGLDDAFGDSSDGVAASANNPFLSAAADDTDPSLALGGEDPWNNQTFPGRNYLIIYQRQS